MRCPACLSENPSRMRFCGKCAAPLVNRCPKCGFESPLGFDFCGRCGSRLSEPRPDVSSQRSASPPVVVTTDPSGTATVILPAYFSALNVDYRYQLSVIGQFAQAIVFKEIAHNSFVIKTDRPWVKVSWQVTGVRHDAWVRYHPPQVEEAKPQPERGYYLHPEFFGQPEEKSLTWLYHPDIMRDAKARWSQEARNSQ